MGDGSRHVLFSLLKPNLTPSELQEAAELFKTVADVMEENAEK